MRAVVVRVLYNDLLGADGGPTNRSATLCFRRKSHENSINYLPFRRGRVGGRDGRNELRNHERDESRDAERDEERDAKRDATRDAARDRLRDKSRDAK